MAWFKVDDKLWGSPKWLALRPSARALWVTAGSYCMDQLTDGVVPAHVIPILGGKETDCEGLIEAGLWEENPRGYKFHDWDEYQPSRASIIEKRDAEAARKAAWRAKRAGQRSASAESDAHVLAGHDGDKGVSPAHVPNMSRSSRPDPTRPDPTTPKGVGVEARKRATQLPKDWRPTTEHQRRAEEAGVDLPREVMKFRSHAEEKGRTAKSWNAAFTRWLITAEEYQARDRPPNREAGTGFWNRDSA